MAEEIVYAWSAGSAVDDEQLNLCARLFSENYGKYSGSDPEHPGEQIRLSAARLKSYLKVEDSFAAMAWREKELIGYAFILRTEVAAKGVVSWVTQLVVHPDYRDRGVAKKLLTSVWSFSDHFAWGLLTCNPYAVRALEKTTRRRCDPQELRMHGQELMAIGQERIWYVKDKTLIADGVRCAVDTGFFVDHSDVGKMIGDVERRGNEWTLGELGEGHEWLAFTFRNQEEFPLTQGQLDQMLSDAEPTVMQAYEGMKLDVNHKWQRHADAEADFVATLLKAGSSVLDFGCGAGRHSIALAKRGFTVTGVDFVPSLVETAKRDAGIAGCESAAFVAGDCRSIDLHRKFDAAICLYDVVGSFPRDDDNWKILKNLAAHVVSGGVIAVSVMNMDRTRAQAKHVWPISQNPKALLDLPPSRTMEASGEVFNPDYYLLDPDTSIVYRKEQFDSGGRLPWEKIIRDRRYTKDEIQRACASAGFRMRSCRYVRLGQWDAEAEASAVVAKEILYVGTRE